MYIGKFNFKASGNKEKIASLEIRKGERGRDGRGREGKGEKKREREMINPWLVKRKYLHDRDCSLTPLESSRMVDWIT